MSMTVIYIQVLTSKPPLDFKLLTRWIKDAYVRRDTIICGKPNQWYVDMVILDVANGLKVHGLNEGVPPWNALHPKWWLETLFVTMDACLSFVVANYQGCKKHSWAW